MHLFLRSCLYMSMYLSTYLCLIRTCLYLSKSHCIYLSVYVPVYFSNYVPVHICLPPCLCTCLVSTYLSTYLSISNYHFFSIPNLSVFGSNASEQLVPIISPIVDQLTSRFLFHLINFLIGLPKLITIMSPVR